jgi:hypothetical protein
MICSTSCITRISSSWRGERVKGNKGARTAGVDGVTPALVAASPDIVAAFLADAREQLKTRTFAPVPVRERMIPKPGTGVWIGAVVLLAALVAVDIFRHRSPPRSMAATLATCFLPGRKTPEASGRSRR